MNRETPGRRIVANRLSLPLLALSTAQSLALAAPAPTTQPMKGPLRVHPQNRRYFTDDSGRAILLVGSHTWNNLQDMGENDPPAAFDFAAYLDFLARNNHNFIRLWRWELVSWNTAANGEKDKRVHFAAPHPWPRTGPGTALDGKPKFDVGRFDEAYFERLRSRVTAARNRGIYVSVMLFEGWGLQFVPDGWKAHPFNKANNINGIDGDVDHDGKGIEIHELAAPAVTRLQEACVRKVIDTVNDLDNVLYEISNENHPPSTAWQYHMIRFIHDYEKTRPRQHPVGMTFQYQGGSNGMLLDSPADWVSPNPKAEGGYDYQGNPPPADGRKVILSDTDHLWGIGGNVAWVWKSFLRGLNPVFMDPYKRTVLSGGSEAQWEPVRRALGVARRLAERVDLATLTPRGELASSGYCLANPGFEYVVYLPEGGEVTLDLQAAPGPFAAEWIHPQTGEAARGENVTGGAKCTLKPPLNGTTVLYLRRLPGESEPGVTAEPPWRPLPLITDGRVADGWCHVGWGGFAVDGDALRTECDPKGLGLLVYKKEKFGNCQIRVLFKSKEARSNAGVFVRIADGILEQVSRPGAAFERDARGKISKASMNKMMESSERDEGPWFAVHRGYEVQIMDENDKLHRTGAIYSLAPSSAESKKPPSEWKTMVITLTGNRILVDLEGKRVTSFDPESPEVPRVRQWFEPKREPKRPEAGYIGLQNHDPGDIVWFREISVRPLMVPEVK